MAYKTNLLALNTAIEAARAGEYGRSIHQMHIAVDQLSITAQNNAASAEKLTDTAESLMQQAGDISSILKAFRLERAASTSN